MSTRRSRSSDKVKEVFSSVRRQLSASLAATVSFALVLGQGDPSAKAGSRIISGNAAAFQGPVTLLAIA